MSRGALRVTMRDVLGADLPVARLADERPRFLAAWWAVETRSALAALEDVESGTVVAFEDLVADPAAEVEAIGGPLGFHDLRIDATRPSHVTAASSPLRSGASPVDSWRARLSPDDATAVIETAHAFGAPLYTDAVYPDRSVIPAPTRT